MRFFLAFGVDREGFFDREAVSPKAEIERQRAVSGCRRVRFGSTVPFSNVIRCRAPDLTLESSIAEYGSALSRGKSDFAEYG